MEVIIRSKNMIAAGDPVFFWMAVSTIRLCETRHINARIVISRIVSDKVEIMAIGPYNGRKILDINTTADSPGNPISEKTGASSDAN